MNKPSDEDDSSDLQTVEKGSVYGFDFSFNGKAKHPHPGIVIYSAVGPRNGVPKVGVIALAITHSTQEISWKDKKAILIPDHEKEPMGLDRKEQYVCLFEQITAFFPDDIKVIRSAGSDYLGQASEEFTKRVSEAWSDFRTR